MSSNLTAFQVEVLVRGKMPNEYYSRFSCYVYDEVIKMFHKWARTPKQALNKCKKYGTPISVRKVDVSVMHKDFEQLPIQNEVYNSDAIRMDEMIWRKRNGRRGNMHKDKTGY